MPVTTIPTAIVPELPSKATPVDEEVAPFTTAVAWYAVTAAASILRAATTRPLETTFKPNTFPVPGTVLELNFW